MSSKPTKPHPWRAFNPGWLQRTPNEQKRDTTHQRLLRK